MSNAAALNTGHISSSKAAVILATFLGGLVIGVVFGLVWRVFDPSLAIYFWPAFGALMFGQHAYRSNRRIRNKDKPESAPPTR